MSDLQNRSWKAFEKHHFFGFEIHSNGHGWGDMNSRFFRLLSDEYEESFQKELLSSL